MTNPEQSRQRQIYPKRHIFCVDDAGTYYWQFSVQECPMIHSQRVNLPFTRETAIPRLFAQSYPQSGG
jgi:hypothetical protein